MENLLLAVGDSRVNLRTLNELRNFHLMGQDAKIGGIQDFLFDDQHWLIRYVLAVGQDAAVRTILISPASITGVNDESRTIHVALTHSQILQSPPLEGSQPVTREVEEGLTNYFQWPAYWRHEAVAPVLAGSRATQTADSTLRSARNVIGYYLQAVDGRIGHIEDLICDDQFWVLRYVVVSTRNWLPGRKVLISPAWITEMDWSDKLAHVNLTRERIRESPHYDSDQSVTAEYQRELQTHYDNGA
jgi:hypothetical protein